MTYNPSTALLTNKGKQTSGGACLLLENGDNSSGSNHYTQLRLGYSATDTYQHFICTEHNAGNGNNVLIYVSDGTSAGVFPTNAILAATIGTDGSGNPNVTTSNINVSGTITGGGISSSTTCVTQAQGDSSTKLASTAYINNLVNTTIGFNTVVRWGELGNMTNGFSSPVCYWIGLGTNAWSTGATTFYVPTSATYSIDLSFCLFQNNCGILQVKINGSSVNGSGKDFYNASTTYLSYTITGVSLNAGSNTINLVNNGKNASSGAYYFEGVNSDGIYIKRTA